MPGEDLNPTASDRRQLWTVLAGALLAMLLAALDQNIVNTALPRIVTDLGGMTHLAWVVTAFLLCSTITAPLYGKLSDSHGRRRMFFVAITLFLAGSLLCGAARSMNQLIGFRAVQGLGAGGLLVLAQAAIADVVAPIDRPRYQGLFTGTFALASVAGPVLGGIITQTLSWRWVFYVNLPFGALALVMIAAGLPAPARGAAGPVDYAGAGLLAGFTTSLLLLLLSGGGSSFAWLSADTASLAAATAGLIALFLWREHRAPEPLIRLALFNNPVFARCVSVNALVTFALFGAMVFLPLYFQRVMGMSPAVAGTMLLPQVAGMLLSAIVGGRIVARLGRTRLFLLGGVALNAAALLSLAGFAALDAGPAPFLVSMACLGLGIGLAMPNLTVTMQNAVARDELGAATGAMIFLRSLGGAAGVAVSGAMLGARLVRVTGGVPATSIATATRLGLVDSFLLCGVVVCVGLALGAGLPDTRLRGRVTPAGGSVPAGRPSAKSPG